MMQSTLQKFSETRKKTPSTSAKQTGQNDNRATVTTVFSINFSRMISVEVYSTFMVVMVVK
jgi:hypothetical protein